MDKKTAYQLLTKYSSMDLNHIYFRRGKPIVNILFEQNRTMFIELTNGLSPKQRNEIYKNTYYWQGYQEAKGMHESQYDSLDNE